MSVGIVGSGGGGTGPQGPQGDPGDDGAQGEQGIQGIQGIPGVGGVWGTISGTLATQIDLQSALDAKQPLDADLTALAGLTATTDNFIVSVASAWASRTPVQAKTTLALVKGDVGLGNVDNTSDASKPVSTAQQTALDLKANLASPTFSGTPSLPTGTTGTTQSAGDSTTKLATTAFVTTADNLKANLASPTFTGTPASTTAAVDTNTTQIATTAYVVGQAYAKLASPTFTGTPAAPTAAAGTNTTQLATTAFVKAIDNNAVYSTVLQASGSHTAGKVAGTYGLGQGDLTAVSGTGTLYPLAVLRIDSADYPTVNGFAPKFRVKAQLFVNDVAPTGNFTFGLHAITRPATSGGVGLCIYTMAAAVASSTGLISAPAVDTSNTISSADFGLPADGYYVLGVVTNATVAASSHLHMNAVLQVRNA